PIPLNSCCNEGSIPATSSTSQKMACRTLVSPDSATGKPETCEPASRLNPMQTSRTPTNRLVRISFSAYAAPSYSVDHVGNHRGLLRLYSVLEFSPEIPPEPLTDHLIPQFQM